MAGFLSKLFGRGGSSTKKYEDIYLTARYRVGQSTEYAFRQAVDASVKEGAFSDAASAADALYDLVLPKTEPEDKADLEKARSRIKLV